MVQPTSRDERTMSMTINGQPLQLSVDRYGWWRCKVGPVSYEAATALEALRAGIAAMNQRLVLHG